MILVDTPLWVDHLRGSRTALVIELDRAVLAHPRVAGELALGHLSASSSVLPLLDRMPRAVVATHAEIRSTVDRHRLQGSGTGHVDAQLLASTLLTPGAASWTRDARLHAAARRAGARVHDRPGWSRAPVAHAHARHLAGVPWRRAHPQDPPSGTAAATLVTWTSRSLTSPSPLPGATRSASPSTRCRG